MQAVVADAGSTVTVPESMKKDGMPVRPTATCHPVMSKCVSHCVLKGSKCRYCEYWQSPLVPEVVPENVHQPQKPNPPQPTFGMHSMPVPETPICQLSPLP